MGDWGSIQDNSAVTEWREGWKQKLGDQLDWEVTVKLRCPSCSQASAFPHFLSYWGTAIIIVHPRFADKEYRIGAIPAIDCVPWRTLEKKKQWDPKWRSRASFKAIQLVRNPHLPSCNFVHKFWSFQNLVSPFNGFQCINRLNSRNYFWFFTLATPKL